MPINPFITNILIDSCAFDPKYGKEADASETILENNDLNLMIAHSTQKEINHPNTPKKVKTMANERIYTIQTNLTPGEQREKQQILAILTGAGKPENMRQDAEHIFEAYKYGSYFVTTDSRILKKREKLRSVGIDCEIVLPSELLALVKKFETKSEGKP